MSDWSTKLSGFFSLSFHYLRSVVGRAATSMAVFCALTWFLWPAEHWHVVPNALSALVISSLAWLTALTPDSKAGTAHDVALFESFSTLLNRNSIDFLRDHDFSQSFNRALIDPFIELGEEWRGAAFEFDSKQYQARLGPLQKKAASFVKDIGLWSFPVYGSERNTVPVEADVPHWRSTTVERVASLNKRAGEMAEAIDEFIRYVRPRIRP